ncbi:MAG: GatB/YqeY domain-containing protein [Acidobacteria bacterium]|nr:GatB/YqeY domain-containing protein [Acidobacteriota bacterium]
MRDRISEDIKQAMKNKEKVRLDTLRLIKAEIMKKETAAGAADLDEAGLIQLLQTMKKQRLESIEQFQKGGREDLIAQEQGELGIIESLLPQQMDDAALAQIVAETAQEIGAEGPKSMGPLMQALKAKVAGRAEGKRVSDAVKAFLNP